MSGELFQKGKRKYLAQDERAAFLDAADKAERDVRTFCGLLHHTGCRISEALAVTVDRIDFSNKVVVLESLKKRKREYSGRCRCRPRCSMLWIWCMGSGRRKKEKTLAKDKGFGHGAGQPLGGG